MFITHLARQRAHELNRKRQCVNAARMELGKLVGATSGASVEL